MPVFVCLFRSHFGSRHFGSSGRSSGSAIDVHILQLAQTFNVGASFNIATRGSPVWHTRKRLSRSSARSLLAGPLLSLSDRVLGDNIVLLNQHHGSTAPIRAVLEAHSRGLDIRRPPQALMTRGDWLCDNCVFTVKKGGTHCVWCGIPPLFPQGLPKANATAARLKQYPFASVRSGGLAAASTADASTKTTPPWKD